MEGRNPTHKLKPRSQASKRAQRGKSAPAQRAPAVPSGDTSPTPVPSPEVKAPVPMETKEEQAGEGKGERMVDDVDQKAADEMAKLNINKLPPEDKESIKFLTAVNDAFNQLFNMVCRGSKDLHAQSFKAYLKNGGQDDGRGFIVFPIQNLTQFLKTGKGHEQTKYITKKNAELQEAAAKENKALPQVVLAPQLKKLLETYDPRKEFVAQVVILMVPLSTDQEAVRKDERRMISQCLLVRHNMEDTYTDKLQKALLERRRADAAKRQEAEKAKKSGETPAPAPAQAQPSQGST